MKANYVLIDYENVQVESRALLKGEHFLVQVFLGPKNLKLHRDLVFAMESIGTSDKEQPKSPAGRVSVDDMIRIAVNDLIKQKEAARPRTPKTLRNAIHARCGKELPAADIDAVYAALVKHGYVKVNGAKVTYALPAAQEAV